VAVPGPVVPLPSELEENLTTTSSSSSSSSCKKQKLLLLKKKRKDEQQLEEEQEQQQELYTSDTISGPTIQVPVPVDKLGSYLWDRTLFFVRRYLYRYRYSYILKKKRPLLLV
jgi:hypothetical protein